MSPFSAFHDTDGKSCLASELVRNIAGCGMGCRAEHVRKDLEFLKTASDIFYLT